MKFFKSKKQTTIDKIIAKLTPVKKKKPFFKKKAKKSYFFGIFCSK